MSLRTMGLARLVPGRPVQLEGPLGVAERVGRALVPLREPGQAAVHPGLADVVADRLELRERVPKRGTASPKRPDRA